MRLSMLAGYPRHLPNEPVAQFLAWTAMQRQGRVHPTEGAPRHHRRVAGSQAPPRVEVPRQPPEEKRLWRHMKLVAKLPERDQRAVLRLIDTADSDDPEDRFHQRPVSREYVKSLWIKLSQGEIQEVLRAPWRPGYG